MKTTHLFLHASILALSVSANLHADTLALSGTGHTGYAAALGINPEPNGFTEDPATITNPSAPTKSHFGMPYYLDTGGSGLWTWLVTTPLSSSNDYTAVGETVYNTSNTDTNFGLTDIGDLTFSKAGISGTGTEYVVVSGSDFAFDLEDLGPMYTPYNTASNNEFFWDYKINSATGNVTLTFVNGTLTSVDGALNIGVAIRFMGVDEGVFTSEPSTFGWDEDEGDFVIYLGPTAEYSGTLTFSGNSFAFNVNQQLSTVYSFLGTLTNTRLILNRAGTFPLTPTP